jgi:hypothetical protein
MVAGGPTQGPAGFKIHVVPGATPSARSAIESFQTFSNELSALTA